MLSKKPDAHSPLDFRSTACLPIIYRLFTAAVSVKVNTHCELNNILTEVQKGCCHNSRRSKDLVTIDSIAVLEGKEHQRNLHMAYIDYKQAFPK